MRTISFLSVIATLLLCVQLSAQPTGTTPTTTTPAAPAPPPAKVDHSYKPLTLKLNDDGSKYVRFIMWHQFWATATQNNPDTRDAQGALVDGSDGSDKGWSTDLALRRSRFLAYAQISPRAMILTHWGINNQSFIGGATAPNGTNATTTVSNNGKKPQLFIHDAWTEYEVVKNKLYLGAGLHYFNGVSRMSSASTLNFMTLDAPIFNWQNIEATDQFARQFGFYAKGQLGRLDYRLALNKPFASGKTPAAVTKNGVADNVINENWATAGYVNWMFWDKESNKLPFFVGSHLGAKKVFNIGVGFYNHAGASLYKSSDGRDSTFQNQTAIGADVYLDMPLNKAKGSALNVLATYYNFNYGTNYLRNLGILNLHSSAATANSFAGAGNAQPTIGTGSIMYLQAGYLLPKFKNGTAFMPYVTVTHKDFERLADPSTQFGFGLNYFVTGHNAKLTLEYQTRPVYKVNAANNNAIERTEYRGELILQTHIFL
ncbi:MAG: porin [Saprospiraceae bacterium]|nr:porin [Saprospiraceae bacterium]